MLKKVIPLSFIMGIRFFSLFLVMPLLAVFAFSLDGATPYLAGFAVGAFALTQVIFQAPFGYLSDKVGRKSTLIIGVVLFVIGSIICAFSIDIYTLIIGRLIQGIGAFGGVISAFVTDLVIDEERPKAMAIMGSSIALSFILSMFLGPIIGGLYGIEILFIIGAILSLLSLVLLKSVPNPQKIHTIKEDTTIFSVLTQKRLLIMYLTNFLQKGLMTLSFVVIPYSFVNSFGWNKSELYEFFIPATIFGLLALPIAVIFAQKKGQFKMVLLLGVGFFILSFALMGLSNSKELFFIGAILFFVAFNLHEPIIQALAAKFSKSNKRGITLGVFNAFGFLGTFLGGVFGGIFISYYGIQTIALIIIFICILWSFMIFSLKNPGLQKNLYLDNYNNEALNLLNEIDGVIDSYLADKRLVVVYDSSVLDEKRLKEILK